MDLQYPSQKLHNLSKQLNTLDPRLGSVLQISSPCLPSKSIPDKIKAKAQNYIKKDKSKQLLNLMQEQAVSLCDCISVSGYKKQIQSQNNGWTILHMSARYNAQNCLLICLKYLYQTEPQNYQIILNLKSANGDTPLHIACLYNNNRALSILLECGGVDVYALNCRKMTGYQIVIKMNNQVGLQMLTKYEVKAKKKRMINKKVLEKSIEKLEKNKINFGVFFRCFVDCFDFSNGDDNLNINQINDNAESDRKCIKAQKGKQQQNIQIVWIDPCKLNITSKNNKNGMNNLLPIFAQNSLPFSIQQNKLIVTNLLPLFLALSEHEEHLKMIIHKCKQKYYIKIGGHFEQKTIWMDNLFPFSNDQPLFMSSRDGALWPMILQKGLSQYFGGYFQAAKMKLENLLEVVTGNFAYTIPFQKQQKGKINQMLKNAESHNCIILLKQRQQNPLFCQQSRIQCCPLLTIHQNSYLILTPSQTQTQTQQTKQMKLIRSHYTNNINCRWLNTQQMLQHFEKGIFCYMNDSRNPKILKTLCVRSFYTERLCLIIKVTKYKQEPDGKNNGIYVSVLDGARQNTLQITACTGYTIKNRQEVNILSMQVLGHIDIQPLSPNSGMMCSQILVSCQVKNIKNSNITVLCRSPHTLELQVLDKTIGDLQFLEASKKYYIGQICNKNIKQIVYKIGEYILVMSFYKGYIELENIGEDVGVIEGVTLDDRVVMAQQPTNNQNQGNIFYAVLYGVEKETSVKIVKIQEDGKDQIMQNSGDVEREDSEPSASY